MKFIKSNLFIAVLLFYNNILTSEITNFLNVYDVIILKDFVVHKNNILNQIEVSSKVNIENNILYKIDDISDETRILLTSNCRYLLLISNKSISIFHVWLGKEISRINYDNIKINLKYKKIIISKNSLFSVLDLKTGKILDLNEDFANYNKEKKLRYKQLEWSESLILNSI